MLKESLHAPTYVSQLLRLAFYESKARRANLSLRQFSKKLGLDAPVVSEVISEKRPVSAKLAIKIMHALQRDPHEIKTVVDNFAKTKKSPKTGKEVLQNESMMVVADWWHFTILAMAENTRKSLSLETILARLNISMQEAKKSLELLEKLELVKTGPKGIRSTGRSLTTAPDIPSEIVKRHHIQGLELAQDSIYTDSTQVRDMSGLTLACELKDMPLIKKKIAGFRKNFEKNFENKNSDHVFKLQVQFFPLTKINKKDQNQ